MKITVLVENNTVSEALEHRHGLSLYIETEKHKLLFDVGPDDSFIRNAEKLGIDISAVDAAVISHGHYDHGGGLAAFFAANSKAPVYIRSNGFIPCWSDTGRYIGLDRDLSSSDRFVFTGEDFIIDDELHLISGIRERICFPSSNVTLLVEKNGERVLDDFEHEQVLVISAGEQTVLLSGCAHNGIINIINKAEAVTGRKMTAVLAGFHMYAPSSDKTEDPAVVDRIAGLLNERACMYYSCHCTGMEAFARMKSILGDRLEYAATGCVFEFPAIK